MPPPDPPTGTAEAVTALFEAAEAHPDPVLNARRLQAAERIRDLARGPEMPHVLMDPPYGLEHVDRQRLVDSFRDMYPALAQWSQSDDPRPDGPVRPFDVPPAVAASLRDPEWQARMIASFVPPDLDIERVQAEQRIYRAMGVANPRPDAPFVLGTDIGPDPNDNGEPPPEPVLPSELPVTWDQNDVGTITSLPISGHVHDGSGFARADHVHLPSRMMEYYNTRAIEPPRTIWQRLMEDPDECP